MQSFCTQLNSCKDLHRKCFVCYFSRTYERPIDQVIGNNKLFENITNIINYNNNTLIAQTPNLSTIQSQQKPKCKICDKNAYYGYKNKKYFLGCCKEHTKIARKKKLDA